MQPSNRPIHLALLAVFASIVCSPALASKTIDYGNHAGDEADIVSTSGLSTARASLRATVTRADAIDACQEGELDMTPECIKSSIGPLRPLTANCPARTFTDFFGEHWRYLGRRVNTDQMAKFRLLHIEIREEADGSSASDYGISLGIFRALCPKQAPPESEGY